MFLPCRPCCGGGCPDDTLVVTISGWPNTQYYTGPYSAPSLYRNYAMGLGYWKPSDYNGAYRVTNTQTDPSVSTCSFSGSYESFTSDDYTPVISYSPATDGSWVLQWNERVPTASTTTMSIAFPGGTGGCLIQCRYSGPLGVTWPRGVTLAAGVDFSVISAPSGFPTSGWSIRIDADVGQAANDCPFGRMMPWGVPTDSNCCTAQTGTIDLAYADPFGNTLAGVPQMDDELDITFGSGADIRGPGANPFALYRLYRTSGNSYTLKATGGFSRYVYDSRSYCPIPGWLYQGPVQWDEYYISGGGLYASGTEQYAKMIVTPPAIQDMFNEVTDALPLPKFFFSAASFEYVAAKFSSGGDTCRAWATKSISSFSSGYWSMPSPGLTVTQL